MKVKLILPALTEAVSPFFRQVKYSLFPPLGLATLAGYLDDADDVTLCDDHVQRVRLDDEPDLVAVEVYVSAARRAYAMADAYRARGVHVCLGGLHVTACPAEAARHADTIFLGPGEDSWPALLADFRAGRPGRVYRSTRRTLEHAPPVRRDLIRRHLYLVPNSIVVSRGCPHRCDFCYSSAFFAGGRKKLEPLWHAIIKLGGLGRMRPLLEGILAGFGRYADDTREARRDSLVAGDSVVPDGTRFLPRWRPSTGSAGLTSTAPTGQGRAVLPSRLGRRDASPALQCWGDGAPNHGAL